MLASVANERDLSQAFNCFHGRSTDREVDESEYASIVSRLAGSPLNVSTPTPEQFWSHLPEICRIQDEPFGSPSICMQYFLMQHSREVGCKVLLDGQGADEILLGYSKYIILALAHAWNSGGLPVFIRTMLNSWKSNASLTPFTTLQCLIATLLSPLRTARLRLRLPFLKLPITPTRKLYKTISSAATDCRRTQMLELFVTSLPALLRYEDRNSMAHSVEARLPFLDYRVVEAALSLSVDQKIYNGWSKYPLRVADILPDQIAWRRSKLGFNAPERSWIGRYSNKMLSHTLDSPLISSICDDLSLERRWNMLNMRERWRLFSVAMWSDIYNVSL